MASTSEPRVAVAVRIRPVIKGGSAMHQQEQFEPIAASRSGDTMVQLQEHKLDEACRSCAFSFDYVFDSDSTQLEVYEDAVVDLIDGALQQGNSATILAYGQTGSGKTHSMLGDVKPNPLDDQLLTPQSGIFLRVLSDLMAFREIRYDKSHVVVGLSCVEIYNDKIRDLFGGNAGEGPPQLKAIMVEEQVLLPSLIIKEVTTLASVYEELQLAIARRQSRSTSANKESSRSHCLFTVDILQRDIDADAPPLELLQQMVSTSKSRGRHGDSPVPAMSPNGATGGASSLGAGFQGTVMPMSDGGPPVYMSKIVIADLAGSEKLRSSGVTGEGMAEATAINSSLTALGNVVHALHGGKLASYRDSNLTRLLKPSFSQQTSRVLLLAQIAPTQLTYEESLSTMHFANKVKQMKMVSDPGVETDKLPFEYLTVSKTLLSLAGEMRLVRAIGNTPPVLAATGSSYRIGFPYNCCSSGSVANPKGKSRVAELVSRAGDASRAGKAKLLAEVAADDAAFEAGLAPLHQTRVRQALQRHRTKVAELEAQIFDSVDVVLSMALDDVMVSQAVGREEVSASQDTAFSSLVGEHRSVLRRAVAKTEVQLRELNQVRMPSLTASDHISAEERAQMQELDVAFATACWSHCNGRRTANQVREVQDAAGALTIAETNRVKLEEWQARTGPSPASPPASTKAASGGL